MNRIIRLLTILSLAVLLPVLTGCENTKANTNEKSGPTKMVLDNNAKEFGIKLSDKEDFSSASDSITLTEGFSTTNTSFTIINFSDALKTNGAIKDSNCFAYTIYVKNEGSEATNIEINLNVKKETRNFGKAMRFAVIDGGSTDEQGNVTFNKGIIYLKNDGHADEVLVNEFSNDETNRALYELFDKEYFKNDNCYGSFEIENLGVNESKKITIIYWIEGNDLDCVDAIIGGGLLMEYVVSIKQ